MLVWLFLLAQGPGTLESRIQEVTVYGGAAHVVRRSGTVSQSGRYVLGDLSGALEPQSVRVRASGGDVLDVLVRERLAEVGDERVAALSGRLQAARRELEVLEGQRAVAEALLEHARQMLRQESSARAGDVQAGRASVEAWEASHAFLARRLEAATAALREAGWRVEEQARRIEGLELDHGRLRQGGARVHDVIVELELERPGTVEVDYLVRGAGWRPAYELRAAPDLSAVAWAYRAEVRQETGEDWRDVELALSTAQPRRGLHPPEPRTRWVSLKEPAKAAAAAARGLAYESAHGDDAYRAHLDGPLEIPVEAQGLSVHFRLPRRWTVESRPQPSTVLVGRGEMPASIERHCVPALDPSVWVRARARNTTDLVLLPGDAAVFAGADFLGRIRLEEVRPGQELEIALGPDPALAVTRVQVDDLRREPGLFSSKEGHVETWRTRIENHGAAGARPDGSVDVIVREALPRSRDSRLEVSMTRAEPKPSQDERWRQDVEERSLQTWVVRVPAGGTADVLVQTTLRFPKRAEVVGM